MTRRWALLAVLALAVTAAPAFAQEDSQRADAGTDRTIAEGRLVYDANCVGCHQADGAGISGTFPPLVDNPRVADADYVASVVRNGLIGESEVGGGTYTGAMPAFALLDDAQVDAVVLFDQEALGEPLPESPVAAPEAGGLAGTELPGAASLVATLGFLAFLVAGAFVLAPVALAPAGTAHGAESRFGGPVAWFKSALIVAYFIALTVIFPSLVIESEWLAGPPSVWGDLFSTEVWDVIRGLIGTGVWLAAIALGMWGLRRVQSRDVI